MDWFLQLLSLSITQPFLLETSWADEVQCSLAMWPVASIRLAHDENDLMPNKCVKPLLEMMQNCLLLKHIYRNLIMPPPLGAGGIMFSGCPLVRPSVCPSKAWNTLIWPVHGSVGPADQPWPFYGMSVRPSVRRGFRAFVGESLEGMAWNFTCWCILTLFRID